MEMRLNIEDRRVADLLVSGLEHRQGIGYWGEIASYKKPPLLLFRYDQEQVYRHLDYPMNAGGALIIREFEDENGKPKRHHLTRDKIQQGLAVMAQKAPHHLANFLREDDDMETSDVFIQCCLFGEVKYG